MHKIIPQDLERILGDTPDYKRFLNKRVLITGGTGFIGGWLVRTFCAAGAQVALTTRAMRKADELAKDFRFSVYKGVERGNINDFDPHIIIHAASPGDPKDYLADPVGCLTCNVGATGMILEYARQSTSQVVFISSGEVYGEASKIPTGEWDFGAVAPGERSVYAISKRAGEALCFAYHRQHGCQTCIARLHHTYGPCMRLDDGRVVPTFVARTLKGKTLQLFGSGNQVRSFCYITDAMTGILAILLKSDSGEAYNVGSPIGCTISELAEKFTSDAVYGDGECSPNQSVVPSTRRLEALDWRHRVSLSDGIKRTLESYR